ncbi:hypothetical protein [Staphylococcus xylosus]|uniref:hypothetical protein n=1 Tax=Staphylococcus xylosus TaxID=1288 RepID=UPI00034B7E9A|nr:hypothetical protein [Staphylococcus xylosus]
MNLKIRSKSGKNYYTTFAVNDLGQLAKTIVENDWIYLRVLDEINRKAILKVDEIESFIEEDKQND